MIAAGAQFNAPDVNVGTVDGTPPLLAVYGVMGLGDGPNGGSLNTASAVNNLSVTVVNSGSGARIGPSVGTTVGIPKKAR